MFPFDVFFSATIFRSCQNNHKGTILKQSWNIPCLGWLLLNYQYLWFVASVIMIIVVLLFFVCVCFYNSLMVISSTVIIIANYWYCCHVYCHHRYHRYHHYHHHFCIAILPKRAWLLALGEVTQRLEPTGSCRHFSGLFRGVVAAWSLRASQVWPLKPGWISWITFQTRNVTGWLIGFPIMD